MVTAIRIRVGMSRMRPEQRPSRSCSLPRDPTAAALGSHALAGEISRGYTEELEHWAWCIRRNPDLSDPQIRPKCHPEVALGDAVVALTTNIAARDGRRIDFKHEWFDPKSDETPEEVKPTVPV